MANKRNITVALDSSLLKKARGFAAARGMSVSALIADNLNEMMSRQTDYEAAKRRALAMMREGFDLGAKPLSRDEIYDRPRLRR
jgi:hypothetical protein